MLLPVLASGFREHCLRSPPADGPGFGGEDADIEELFKFPKSGIISLICTEGPLEHVVLNRLSPKCSHGLQPVMFIVRYVD